MHITTPAFAVIALLTTGAAFGHDDVHESSQDTSDQHQQMHQQNEDDSAHGYQNPTGVDPDPRMDEHPEPTHDEDDEELAD